MDNIDQFTTTVDECESGKEIVMEGEGKRVGGSRSESKRAQGSC